MTISTLNAGTTQTHSVKRGFVSNGTLFAPTNKMGDGTVFQTADDRYSMVHSFFSDLPKGAIIDDAWLEFEPFANNTYGVPNSAHAMALIASDGHWDRCKANELHIDAGSDTTYGAPSIGLSTQAQLLDSGSNVVADSKSGAGGFPVTSGNNAQSSTYGTTIELPAGDDLKSIKFTLGRADTAIPAQPQDVRVHVYTLRGNDRHYAVETLIAVSAAVQYGALPTSAALVEFTLTDAITATGANRWLGICVEGEWLDPVNHATQRLKFKQGVNFNQTAYGNNTAGSVFHATKEVSVRYDNSFPIHYRGVDDVPALYPALSTSVMTTPYQRYFGTVMHNAGVSNWIAGVKHTYGSASADDEFPGFVANLQAWLRSDHYDPSEGTTWIGLIMEVPSPDDSFWELKSPTLGANVSLVIDWHTTPDLSITSFGTEASFTAESEATEQSFTSEASETYPLLTAVE